MGDSGALWMFHVNTMEWRRTSINRRNNHEVGRYYMSYIVDVALVRRAQLIYLRASIYLCINIYIYTYQRIDCSKSNSWSHPFGQENIENNTRYSYGGYGGNFTRTYTRNTLHCYNSRTQLEPLSQIHKIIHTPIGVYIYILTVI